MGVGGTRFILSDIERSGRPLVGINAVVEMVSTVDNGAYNSLRELNCNQRRWFWDNN